MLVNGFIKTSMLDYPEKISSVIFLGGCNFRCGFCHNADMVLRPKEIPKFDVESIFRYLEKKKDWLDGVCVTGGEPTLQNGLLDLLKRIKEMGLLVKLDSNGTNPEVLKQVIDEGLVDYLAMDIKTSKEKYAEAVGVNVDIIKIEESINLIKNSGIEYEFRTTAIPNLIDEAEVKSIGEWLRGAKKYCLQQFMSIKVLDESYYDLKPYLKGEMMLLGKAAEEYFDKVEVRGV